MAVFFVTNYYETIDRAILRAGRIDTHALVLPYNKAAEIDLLKEMLTKALSKDPNMQRKAIEFAEKYLKGDSELSQLITFREAEQLSDLIIREIKIGSVPSTEDLAEWSTSLSITPDIYAKREISAFREVCAVIGRVLNENSPSSKYTSLNMESAKNYLKENQHRLGRSPWADLSERWTRLLETEITKR